MSVATGYAATRSSASLAPLTVERRAVGPRDVRIEVRYCGVCHSDVHQVHNDWANTVYPCMPGHEIVGQVVEVGAEVTRLHAGQLVGVGCMVDSCRTCASCEEGLEQYCTGPVSFTGTYNGPFTPDGTNTYGGYSDHLVVDEHFVLTIPDALKPHEAAPILCAGITTYSPLRHWKVGPGTVVGVAGIGGLGHMAVKMAKAMGARVVALTTSEDKTADIRSLGADEVVLTTNKEAMTANAESLDFILDTIPYEHELIDYLKLLRRDGAMAVVGLLMPVKQNLEMMEILTKRRSLAGSLIGGIPETQEVLDFCAEHGIAPETEIIPIQDVNKAFKHLKAGDVRFRYVIDMSTLKADPEATPDVKES